MSRLELYFDITHKVLIEGLNNGNPFVLAKQQWQNKMPLRIQFVKRKPAGGLTTRYELVNLALGDECKVAIGNWSSSVGNPLAGVTALTLDAYEDDFTGTLDLETAEMQAALDAASGADLSLYFEIEYKLAGVKDTGQSRITVGGEVITSGVGSPAPVAPTNEWADNVEALLPQTDTILITRVADTLELTRRLGAVAWTARDSERAWGGIACSEDGRYLACGTSAGNMYTSADHGATWTARDSARNWAYPVVARDGSVMYCQLTAAGDIYKSSDYGVTWASLALGSTLWTGRPCASDDGGYFFTVIATHLYRSTNGGSSFATVAVGTGGLVAVACSGNGQFVAVADFAGNLYTSTDYGATFTERESDRNWVSLCMSKDGRYLVAVSSDDGLFTSSDYGVTWTLRTTALPAFTDLKMSRDGLLVVGTVATEVIWQSFDYGHTWHANRSERSWSGVCISGIGGRLAGSVSSGYIYTAENPLTSDNAGATEDHSRLALAYGASIAIDLAGSKSQTIAATGDVTLSTANRNPGNGRARAVAVFITASGGARTITLAGDWKKTAATIELAEDEVAAIALESHGANESDVHCSFTVLA